MKHMKVFLFLGVGLIFTACSENPNHREFEPTSIQTEQQKAELNKLVIQARANYEAKQKESSH